MDEQTDRQTEKEEKNQRQTLEKTRLRYITRCIDKQTGIQTDGWINRQMDKPFMCAWSRYSSLAQNR